jgi:hypothetical protein
MLPPTDKNKKKFFTLFLVLFATFFYLSSCNNHFSKTTINDESKEWMEAFFRDLLLVEGGIYTLLGSKPITQISLETFTEEEKQAYVDSLSKKELENALVIEDYSLPQHWEKWKKISAQFPLKRYLLLEKETKEHAKSLYFINIFQTAVTIEENYEAFRKVVHFDFNPLEVVLEMQDANSKFWEVVEDNDLLKGLLLGYGKINAYAFFWKYESASPRIANFMSSLADVQRNDEFIGKVQFSPKNFDIPLFTSFESNRTTQNKYKQERQAIQTFYQKKDFVKATLDILTQ